ncbi:hypothetical protein PTE_04141 [Photorhabdus khanii NC19]|nr:hypothetical protein PTE_04141 [Photorhabdus khanii NC19]
MTLSLFSQSPIAMTVTADTASERAYLPAPHTLRNNLDRELHDAVLPGLSLWYTPIF